MRQDVSGKVCCRDGAIGLEPENTGQWEEGGGRLVRGRWSQCPEVGVAEDGEGCGEHPPNRAPVIGKMLPGGGGLGWALPGPPGLAAGGKPTQKGVGRGDQ